MKKVLLIVLVIAFAAVCFVGCAPKTETSGSEASGSADASAAAVDDSLDKIKEKVYRMCFRPLYLVTVKYLSDS